MPPSVQLDYFTSPPVSRPRLVPILAAIGLLVGVAGMLVAAVALIDGLLLPRATGKDAVFANMLHGPMMTASLLGMPLAAGWLVCSVGMLRFRRWAWGGTVAVAGVTTSVLAVALVLIVWVVLQGMSQRTGAPGVVFLSGLGSGLIVAILLLSWAMRRAGNAMLVLILAPLAAMGGAFAAALLMMPESFADLGLVLSIIGAVLALMIYPVTTLIYMTRPQVIAAFTSARL